MKNKQPPLDTIILIAVITILLYLNAAGIWA